MRGVLSIRLVAGAALLALVATDADAQNAPSVAGTYCGTWASGFVWQMSLQQNGSNVSASINGKTKDGATFSGSGSGTLTGSQITMNATFSRGAGTFSGKVSGGAIAAAFSRTDPDAPKRRDSARFTRC